jgi:hypothetical protein
MQTTLSLLLPTPSKPPPTLLVSCKATSLPRLPQDIPLHHKTIQLHSPFPFPHACTVLLVALMCIFPVGANSSYTSCWTDMKEQHHYCVNQAPPAHLEFYVSPTIPITQCL